MKHTPGPWKAIAYQGHAATSIISDHAEQTIQIAECSGFGRHSNECLADARLIAAAPDLVEALAPFVARNSSEETITITVRTEDVTRARAAIAKATGEA